MALIVENLFKKKDTSKNSKSKVQTPRKPLLTKKTAPSPLRQNSGVKKTRGWLGGEGGPRDSLNKWYGPNRALFLPKGLFDSTDIPSYLTGELPGDYGYDPLGLGKDPEQVVKYREAELIHARWAMLAAAGFVIPEGLEANGADIVGGTWFETGAKMLNGGTLNYFAVPWKEIPNPLPLFLVIAIEAVLMFGVETFRRAPGSKQVLKC